MPREMLPGFRNIVQDWVIKQLPSLPPRKLSEDEIERLACATLETLAQRALGKSVLKQETGPAQDEGQPFWGNLAVMTRGWIVQRAPKAVPTPVGVEDYERMVRHALEGLLLRDRSENLTAELQTLPETDFPAQVVSGNDEVLPDGRVADEVLAQDPFYFARQHLALSL